MKLSRQIVALLLMFTALVPFTPQANACGPETLQPIFVFEDSPDPPFREFTQGKIGIVKSSFGRKTLAIAYRYLAGGSFNADEQQELLEALKGTPPEPDGEPAVKSWIAARKVVLKGEGDLSKIYREREYGGYDFFPNCSNNAFEVATETLKDRVGRFGSDNPNVHEWLTGQDAVFRNCAEGSDLPASLGPESPEWLRKDREYQTAASLFYSLKFEQARTEFERIAQDSASDWQQTADYLVGRTMVRQGSLEPNDELKRSLYERAEIYLVNLLSRTTKFRSGTQKLLGLVKYRLRPEERVRELAQVVAEQNGNENLRQDLIDYVWLLDKFDEQIQKAEEERLKLLNPPNPETTEAQFDQKRAEREKVLQAVQRGELIEVWFYALKVNEEVDPSEIYNFNFKPDASEAEILQTVETRVGRKLLQAESNQLWDRHKVALESLKWKLSPNRKFDSQFDYEGCDYHCNDLRLDLLPSFLRVDQLNDWIFTFQSDDPQSYFHALSKWRETQSEVWFIAALSKAEKKSPSLKRLLDHGETVKPDDPMFGTVAYNRIRLLRDVGKDAEARKLVDEIIANRFDMLPLSAQNQFVELRMQLAQNITEFLKFAARKPVVFYEYGKMGRIADIMGVERNYREDQGLEEQHKRRVEQLLKWDERLVFDEKVVEILNWHFPLTGWVAASNDPALPDYLRERILFTVWTRAILLKNDSVAQQAANEIIERGMDSSGIFNHYSKARTAVEKEDAATFALLKLPSLSPYLEPGLPNTNTAEDEYYYYEVAWWCTLPETEFDGESSEVPKRVPSPKFLGADFLAAAQKERTVLGSIGNAKKYLGKRAIEWAKQRPQDPRVPEALFIATMANQHHKYGCGGWEHDEELMRAAETLLREKYPNSPWVIKLPDLQQ